MANGQQEKYHLEEWLKFPLEVGSYIRGQIDIFNRWTSAGILQEVETIGPSRMLGCLRFPADTDNSKEIDDTLTILANAEATYGRHVRKNKTSLTEREGRLQITWQVLVPLSKCNNFVDFDRLHEKAGSIKAFCDNGIRNSVPAGFKRFEVRSTYVQSLRIARTVLMDILTRQPNPSSKEGPSQQIHFNAKEEFLTVPYPIWQEMLSTIRTLQEDFGVRMHFMGANSLQRPVERQLRIRGSSLENVFRARDYIERKFIQLQKQIDGPEEQGLDLEQPQFGCQKVPSPFPSSDEEWQEKKQHFEFRDDYSIDSAFYHCEKEEGHENLNVVEAKEAGFSSTNGPDSDPAEKEPRDAVRALPEDNLVGNGQHALLTPQPKICWEDSFSGEENQPVELTGRALLEARLEQNRKDMDKKLRALHENETMCQLGQSGKENGTNNSEMGEEEGAKECIRKMDMALKKVESLVRKQKEEIKNLLSEKEFWKNECKKLNTIPGSR